MEVDEEGLGVDVVGLGTGCVRDGDGVFMEALGVAPLLIEASTESGDVAATLAEEGAPPVCRAAIFPEISIAAGFRSSSSS